MRERFLEGMSRAAWQVSIVTTDGPAGRAGLTVSAVTSLSADSPNPSLLVCLHDANASTPIIRENGVFCVSILCEQQKVISDAFATRRLTPEEKFATGTWERLSTGAPALSDALAVFDCRLEASLHHGTHWVLVGGVVAMDLPRETSGPLVHSHRHYGGIHQIDG